MYAIAKITKFGYKFLEFIDVTGAIYFTYDVRNAMTWGTLQDPKNIIKDKEMKQYKVVELKPQSI
jgi:hypothetical protein